MNTQKIRESDNYTQAKINFLSTTVDYDIKDYMENLKYLIKLHSKTAFKNESIKAKILAYKDLLKEAEEKF